MKAFLRSALLVALIPGFFPDGTANARPLEIEDLFRTQRVSDPQVSPDGRTVAFVLSEVEKAENRLNSDIWLVDIDGNRPPRKLTSSPKHDRHPRWSPDGKWIVFESNRDENFQVYIIPSDGGEARKLTSLSTE